MNTIEIGQKYQVVKGGKMMPDAEPWESKWKKGEVWEVIETEHSGLVLRKWHKNGIGSTRLLSAITLVRHGIKSGKLKAI